MSDDVRTRSRNMVLGALVADAATMGLHWIYDQAHLEKIAGETPEFTPPDPKNFDGVPAYFAHAARCDGQPSQYGEQLRVMLMALAEQDGGFDLPTYIAAFRSHFGYGGAYVGYIDGATRGSLENYRRADEAAMAAALAVPYDGDAAVTRTLANKAVTLAAQFEGQVLKDHFAEALQIIYGDDAAIRTHGEAVLNAVAALPPARGAADLQLPAIAKLPGLIPALWAEGTRGEAFDAAVDDAVRATSDHPEAQAYGKVAAHMLAAAMATDDIADIIAAGRAAAEGDALARLDQAIEMQDQDTNAATRHFGLACDLSYGVPCVVHNLNTSDSYAQAVRRNILAGGDNCGRAMLLGAVLGAVHGVGGAQGIPEDWVTRLQTDIPYFN